MASLSAVPFFPNHNTANLSTLPAKLNAVMPNVVSQIKPQQHFVPFNILTRFVHAQFFAPSTSQSHREVSDDAGAFLN